MSTEHRVLCAVARMRLSTGAAGARRLVALLLVAQAAGAARAQWPDAWRERWVRPVGDTLRIDTLTIVPESLVLLADSMAIPGARFALLPYSGTVVMKDAPDSVLARYRALPLLLGGTFRHKDPARLTAPGQKPDPFKYVPPRAEGDLVGLRGLTRSGSISRGVLFGNNQDLSVNSTLNLELGGKLSDRIGIAASITDNNIPIQAGGNTLELQDFDQVFIKLFEEAEKGPGNAWELIAGDFVLQRPQSHFLTYLKKTKGLSFETRAPLGDRARMQLGASAAISKGKFARNVIQGVEGNQGPYRLRGNDAGSVIIVLSGSERVFIDGQQLTRGQENDYVIDYNTAEVTFTARRLITKDRRIVVEFQYSDKNYARSLIRIDDAVERGRSTWRLHVYSEQDHRNQPLQQQLSAEEREVLRAAGDDPLAAVVPGADSTGFATDQVLYWRTDSLGYAPVYVWNTHPDSALFRVVFSEVGAGSGDYVLQEFTPNGRVFRWVAPDTVDGAVRHRGTHAPVRLLIAPRAQQMITAGWEHRSGPRTRLGAEAAFSNLDANTFSPAGAADNSGFGLMARGQHGIPISARDTSLHLLLGAEAEATSRHFRFVERYRAVEFERNWNLIGADIAGDQLLAGASVGIAGRRIGQASVGASTFQVRDRFTGWRPEASSALRLGRFDLLGTGSWLLGNGDRISDFRRHKGTARVRLKPFTIGINDEQERNRFRLDSLDGLRPGSYAFHEWEAFIQSPDTFRNKWRLAAGQRTDEALRDGRLARATLATSYAFGIELARNPRNRLATTATYRRLEIVDTALTAQRPQDTYLARVDYDVMLWKGAAVIDFFNEFGSGLEQQREYIYVQVPAGQGLYIWNDYNGNGIKELNEFEVANFGYEANYLRVFVPSTSYVRTYSNQTSLSIDLRPGARWADAQGLRRFIARFSDLASARVDRKTSAEDPLLAIDPFLPDRRDPDLRAYTASARNTVYFDRSGRVWSIDHTWQSDRSRTLLLNGFESRARRSDAVRARWNITRHWTFDAEGERGGSSSDSDLLTGRTWAIRQESVKPRLTWQPGTTLRAQLAYKHTVKRNREEFGGEQAELRDLGMELRLNAPGKGSLLITANLVDIAYDGAVNTSLANELLGGLRPGTNGTWSVSLQRNLSSNLQVDLTYNGRRSEGLPVVHVGGAQVRAFF